MPKVIISQQRSVYTYAELWWASEDLLHAANPGPLPPSRRFLASLILTAFSFEAYLNHIGPEFLKCWDNVERLSPMTKLRLLLEISGAPLSWETSKRPLQTVLNLNRFRNTVAHGQSEELDSGLVQATLETYNDALGEPLLTDWEKLASTNEFPIRARQDVQAVLEKLQERRKPSAENLFTTGGGSGSATLVP